MAGLGKMEKGYEITGKKNQGIYNFNFKTRELPILLKSHQSAGFNWKGIWLKVLVIPLTVLQGGAHGKISNSIHNVQSFPETSNTTSICSALLCIDSQFFPFQLENSSFNLVVESSCSFKQALRQLKEVKNSNYWAKVTNFMKQQWLCQQNFLVNRAQR